VNGRRRGDDVIDRIVVHSRSPAPESGTLFIGSNGTLTGTNEPFMRFTSPPLTALATLQGGSIRIVELWSRRLEMR